MSSVISMIINTIDQSKQAVELTDKLYPTFAGRAHLHLCPLDMAQSQDPTQQNLKRQRIESALQVLAPYVPHQCFIMALLYVDRATKSNTCFFLHSGNAIIVAIVSLMTAFKFYSETQDLLPNTDFASLLGITPNELKMMELAFLDMINFSPYVKKHDFDAYVKELVNLEQMERQTKKANQAAAAAKSNQAASSSP